MEWDVTYVFFFEKGEVKYLKGRWLSVIVSDKGSPKKIKTFFWEIFFGGSPSCIEANYVGCYL